MNFSPAGWVLILIGTIYNCYLYGDNSVQYSTANSICKSYETNLAQFESQTEYDVVKAYTANSGCNCWYFVGYEAKGCTCTNWWTDGINWYCDNIVNNWYYLTGGLSSTGSAYDVSPYLPWQPSLPNIGCQYPYLLFNSFFSFFHNWPDSSGYKWFYLCESSFLY